MLQWKTIVSVRLKMKTMREEEWEEIFTESHHHIKLNSSEDYTRESTHMQSKTKRRWIDWNYFAISMEILSLIHFPVPVQHTIKNISFRCQISLETNKHFINASTHLMYVKLSEGGESWGRHKYILIVLLLILVECISTNWIRKDRRL